MPLQEPIQARPFPRELLHALREGGYDVSALVPAPESDPETLSSPDTPEAGPQQACHLLCAVYQATGDPAIGLWLGSRMQPDLLGLAGMPAMAGPSARAKPPPATKPTTAAIAAWVPRIR